MINRYFADKPMLENELNEIKNEYGISQIRYGISDDQYINLSPELQRAIGPNCLSNKDKLKIEIEDLISKVKRTDDDTGSSEVQSIFFIYLLL